MVNPAGVRGEADNPQLSRVELEASARVIGDAVFRIGCIPGGGEGAASGRYATAFLISRTDRLLATAGHAADISRDGDNFSAVQNKTGAIYRIRDAYYHPRTLRWFDEGLLGISDEPRDGRTAFSSPDVAILRLAEGGPELPAECELASPAELESLGRDPIGLLGFEDRGKVADDEIAMFRSSSCRLATGSIIGRTTLSERPRPSRGAGPADGPWFLSDKLLGGGASGGPVFLKNGRVIAVYSHGDRDPLGERSDRSIWANAIRETLSGMKSGGEPTALEARESLRRAVRHVREAERSITQGDHRAAGRSCNEALRLVPGYSWARFRRSQNYLDYCWSEWDRLSPNDRCTFSQYAFNDVDASLKDIGYTYDERALVLGYATVFRGVTKRDLAYVRGTVEGLTESITAGHPEATPAWMAEMVNLRGFCLEYVGEFDRAMADHTEAIRLDPSYSRWLLERANFLARRGGHALARRDRDDAKALEENPQGNR